MIFENIELYITEIYKKADDMVKKGEITKEGKGLYVKGQILALFN